MKNIKEYKEKLEREIDDFAEHYPVNERTVATLTAMLECYEHVKACAACGCGGELTKEDAMAWMYNMKNEDGSIGAHWDVEQTRPYMDPRGVHCEAWMWAAIMNMMYSDYCKAARKNNVDRPEFYADLAAAFLDDRDAPEDKAGRYYHLIAQSHN